MTKKAATADQPAPSAPQSTEAIEKERLEYLGGTTDELDTEDLSSEDRGDIADPALIEAAAKKKEEDDATAAAEKEVADAAAVAEKEITDKAAEDKKEAVAKAAADKKEKDDAKAKDADKDKEGAKDDAAGKDDKSDDKGDDKKKDDKKVDVSGEAKDDDAAAAKKDDKPKPGGIPKARFDQVNERRRVAEEEIKRRDDAAAAAKDAKENKFDFEKAEDEYIEFMLDGKKEEAKAKRSEIRSAEKAEWKAEAVGESTSTVADQQSAAEVDDLTDQAQELYPVFNSNHEDFSPEITAKTLAFYNGYKVTKPPGVRTDADAMVMAIADTIQLYDLNTKYHPKPEDKDGDDKKPDEKKPDEKKLPEKTEIDKKLKDAEQQGTPVIKGGDGSDSRGAAVPDIEDMTDEELDALPAATISRMRGDDAG